MIIYSPSRASRLYAIVSSEADVPDVFWSRNRGGSWDYAGEGLPKDATALCLAVSPTGYDSVLAGYGNGLGIYRTTTHGWRWSPWGETIDAEAIETILFAEPGSTLLYAGATGGATPGVHRSTDTGETWSFASSGLGGTGVRALANNPATPEILLAATTSGVARTTDGGQSWTHVLTGSPGRNVSWCFDRPLVVYASQDDGGIFRSSDAGETWSSLPNPLDRGWAIAAHPRSGSTLFAGGAEACTFDSARTRHTAAIYKTTNAGASWTRVYWDDDCRAGAGDVTYLLVDAVEERWVYAAGDGGMHGRGFLRSSAHGNEGTFLPVLLGIPRFEADWFGASLDGRLFLMADKGIFRSTNEGGSWALTSYDMYWYTYGLPPFIVVTRSSGMLFRCGLEESGHFFIDYCIHSTDGGHSWSNPWDGEPAPRVDVIKALITDLGTGDVVYCWARDDLLRSDDRGETFFLMSGDIPTAIDAVIDPTDADRLFMATAERATGRRGMRGGGVDRFLYRWPDEERVRVRVHLSTDGGASWTERSSGLPAGPPVRIHMDRADPDHLLLISRRHPPGETLDGGLHWISTGIDLQGTSVIDSDWDPVANRVFLATAEHGVLISDRGFANVGLPTRQLISIAFCPTLEKVFVATEHCGIYGLSVASGGQASTLELPGAAPPRPAPDLMVSPNPFYPATIIRFVVPAGGRRVDLVAFDAAGRRVRTLIARPLGPGLRTVTWDGRTDGGTEVAGGIYFLRLDVEGEVRTKRVTVLR
jgi:photosystem II stability/assembly factor-like uncharacterized protein